MSPACSSPLAVVPANNIARWDGSSWSALGSGIGDPNSYNQISALAVSDTGELFAGGSFSKAGGVNVNNLAKWDGHNWSALAVIRPVPCSRCRCADRMSMSAAIYRSRNGFRQRTNRTMGRQTMERARHRRWWRRVRLRQRHHDRFAGALYAGGNFTEAGGAGASYVAKWNGDTVGFKRRNRRGIYAAAVSPRGDCMW